MIDPVKYQNNEDANLNCIKTSEENQANEDYQE